MSERVWRLNLVLMGWAALAVAAACVVGLYLPNSDDAIGRYRMGESWQVDTATGDMRSLIKTADGTMVLSEPIARQH
jgi:hypothetical protein